MSNILWFRRDLRISDNKALFYATKSAHVIALYIENREFQARHTMSIAQQDFILHGLYLLKKELEELNIPLIFLNAQKTKDIPELIEKTLRLYQATTLFLNNEYEADEKTRDAHVKKYLTQQGFKYESFDDQCILSPSLIKTGVGGIFKMFTPFKNAWLKKMKEYPIILLDRPKKQSKLNFNNQETEILFNENKLWLAGEKEARHRLNYFIENQLDYTHLPFVHRNTIGRGFKTPEHPKVNHTEKNISVEFLADGKKAFEYFYPNVWILHVSEKMKLMVFFVPIDETHTLFYLRTYRSFLNNFLVKRLFDWVMNKSNLIILNQDQHVVASQGTKPSYKAENQLLMKHDTAIKLFRKHWSEQC